MKKLIYLLLIALPIFWFVQFGAQQNLPFAALDDGETFGEECQNEGCNTEEVKELHESYASECLDEDCDLEEVREISGSVGAINAMLDDFRAKGWRVDNCTYWGGCQYAPGNRVSSGDQAFAAHCTQASINQHWADFGFEKDSWDQGFGWEDPCNIDLPLGRTFNALNLLDLYGTHMPPGSNNWLPFFYSFCAGAIDELHASCDFGNPQGCTRARNVRGLDDYTTLYWPFFYHNKMTVPGRLSTFIHEARHADGKSHDCSGCSNGASCDSKWDYYGANYYAVMYLWWLRAAGAPQVTTPLRDLAQVRGNEILADNFCSGNPSRATVYGNAGVPNPNTVFQIP